LADLLPTVRITDFEVRKGVGPMVVTFDALFAYTMVLIAVAALIIRAAKK
jgi:hypothetical protein